HGALLCRLLAQAKTNSRKASFKFLGITQSYQIQTLFADDPIGQQAIVFGTVKQPVRLVGDETLVRVIQSKPDICLSRVDVDARETIAQALQVRVEIHPTPAQARQTITMQKEARELGKLAGWIKTIKQTLVNVFR